MMIEQAIKKYLEDMALSWSPTTLKSEGARLRALAPHINGDPRVLLRAVQGRGKYTQLTSWTRVITFWDWALDGGWVEGGSNPYRVFKKKRANLFRHSYQRRLPVMNYEKAEELIKQMRNVHCRDRALLLLKTGMRWAEAGQSPTADGHIVGKGGKSRKVYHGGLSAAPFPYSYQTFRRALMQDTGLKPHDLRKLALSRLVEVGANPFELAQVAGWSSVNTAQSYIKLSSDSLSALTKKAWG